MASRTPQIVRALRQERERLGITQGDLARRAGWSVSILRDWERGKHSPTVLGYKDLADALGVEIILKFKDGSSVRV